MNHELALSILKSERNYEQKLFRSTSDKFPEAKRVKQETINKLQNSIDVLENENKQTK